MENEVKKDKNVREKKTKANSQPLIDRLTAVMQGKRHTRHDLASMTKLSYIHVVSIMNGTREFAGLSLDKQRLIAEYMGISFAQMYIYLGILRPEDFYIKESFEDRADLTFIKMKKDPFWSSSAPPDDEWVSLPKTSKMLIVLMYEQISKDLLIDKSGLAKP